MREVAFGEEAMKHYFESEVILPPGGRAELTQTCKCGNHCWWLYKATGVRTLNSEERFLACVECGHKISQSRQVFFHNGKERLHITTRFYDAKATVKELVKAKTEEKKLKETHIFCLFCCEWLEKKKFSEEDICKKCRKKEDEQNNS